MHATNAMTADDGRQTAAHPRETAVGGLPSSQMMARSINPTSRSRDATEC